MSLRWLSLVLVAAMVSVASAEPPDPKTLPPLELDPLEALKRDVEAEEKEAAEKDAATKAGAPPGAGASDANGKDSGDDVDYDLGESQVEGAERPEILPAAQFRIDLDSLDAIPRRSAAEHLMLAPGVLTTNPGGEGHAEEVYIRGFAASGGSDLEVLIDGAPINEVSNAHGHGYVDLAILPPEVIRGVDVTAGSFDARQGDFAFAGTAAYRLGVRERGSRVLYGYGSWNSHRALMLWAPEEQDEGTFAAFEYKQTDGFGRNRAAESANVAARYAHDPGGDGFRWSLGLYGGLSRWDQAGVVREDDFRRGDIGFYGTYDPNQGGETQRLMAVFRNEAGPSESQFESTTFFGFRNLRIRENFTGFANDEAAVLEQPQRGDGVEQRYDALTVGSRGSYTWAGDIGGLRQSLAFGYALRYDRGSSALLRLRALTAIPYGRLFDYEYSVLNAAGWVQAQIRPLEWLTLRAGVRLDGFSFGVTDNLGEDSDREGEREPDFTIQALGLAVNPRASVEFALWPGGRITASYGQGTRSTEAAALSDNERAPFATADEVEAGVAQVLGGGKDDGYRLQLQAAYVFADVTQELLFDEVQTRNTLIGGSDRHAVLFGLRAQVGEWFDGLVNVGWAQATLDATGERLPYIPEWVVRLDAVVQGDLFGWHIDRVPVSGTFGLGFTYVPGRPLPFRQFGDDYYLVNLGADLRLWHVTLGIDIRNLFDQRYRQSEFNFASNFAAPDAPPSQLPVRHFVAGEPFFAMMTATFHLEDLLRGYVDE